MASLFAMADSSRLALAAMESASFHQASPLQNTHSVSRRAPLRAAGNLRFVLSADKQPRRRKSIEKSDIFYESSSKSVENLSKSDEEEANNAATQFDVKAQAEAVAASLDENGLLETVRFLHGSSVLPLLVAPVLKRVRSGRSALEFFHWVQEHGGFEHTLYTYNSLLAALLVHRSNYFEQVYERMLKDGVSPDRDTYNLIVKGLAKANNLDGARHMLLKMIDEGFNPDVVTCGTVVEKFCNMRRVPEVCELFQELDSNGVSIGILAYNAILRALLYSGDFNGGYRFTDMVVEDGSLPHVLAYKTMLDCLIKTGKTREASEVLGTMIKKSVPDATTFTAMISVLCKHNRADDAMKVFEIMLEKDLVPSVEVYTSLLSAHCRTRKLDSAYGLFMEMIERGYGPSSSAYGLLLRCLCNGGRAHVAYDIHNMMRIKGYFPDENTYASLIYSSCLSGRVDDAKELFKELLNSENLSVDAGLYNVLIEGLCRSCKVYDALELTADMVDKGCVPTLQTYNALLMGFFRANEYRKAIELFYAMEEKGFQPNAMVYNTFIDGLCKAGRVDEAHEFFRQSIGRGCIPDNVTYNALIRGLYETNRVEDARRLYVEMVDKGYIADRSLRELTLQN